ncbi:GSCOCG00008182001-RA-CDS, partial [Cotesia congregata]
LVEGASRVLLTTTYHGGRVSIFNTCIKSLNIGCLNNKLIDRNIVRRMMSSLPEKNCRQFLSPS